MANQLKEWIEGNILSNIPGYRFLKGMGESAVGLTSQELKEVVLVDVEEVWQIGFDAKNRQRSERRVLTRCSKPYVW